MAVTDVQMNFCIFKIALCGPGLMRALNQTDCRSLKPKQMTWCLLQLVFAGLLQVLSVVWVGKKVCPENTRGAAELQAKGAWDGGKLRAHSHTLYFATAFKEQL